MSLGSVQDHGALRVELSVADVAVRLVLGSPLVAPASPGPGVLPVLFKLLVQHSTTVAQLLLVNMEHVLTVVSQTGARAPAAVAHVLYV